MTNIIEYIIGNYRYKLWYSKFKFLLRKHIIEQIEFRIDFMKSECYLNGVCIKCGCTTTALQMANKSCDLPCYPEMMNKEIWSAFKCTSVFIDENGRWAFKFNNHDIHYDNKEDYIVHQKLIFYPNSIKGESLILTPSDKLKLI